MEIKRAQNVADGFTRPKDSLCSVHSSNFMMDPEPFSGTILWTGGGTNFNFFFFLKETLRFIAL